MVVTIRLPDFLSVIQVTIQVMDHSAIGLLLAIWLPDVADSQMPTVPGKLFPISGGIWLEVTPAKT